MTRPGMLAIRAINQYRRRDVLAYLGLRYYLESSAARSDRWAQEVAPDLVLRRTEPSYLAVRHFKEVDALGAISHREMFLPGPNEALAESALLDACGKAGGAFVPADSVFSYRLATDQDDSGVYRHYMHGLRQRHAAVAEACRNAPDAKVLFLDIRRFYPSVTVPHARSAWTRACETSSLGSQWVDLGMRLLEFHGRTSGSRDGHILTGPMFSHLIGNLLLRHVDQKMAALQARYFRYVDDITLVGSQSEVDRSLAALKAELEHLGLDLHAQDSSKSLTVSAKTWLQGEEDYAEAKTSVSWMTMIGDLKRLLLTRPELHASLVGALANSGLRVPVPDYSAAIGERTYRTRMAELFRTSWFRKAVRTPSVQGVVDQAEILRTRYHRECLDLLGAFRKADPFLAKRLLPKLRYRFGRLAYVGDLSQLSELAAAADGIPSLRFQSAVAQTIVSGDVSEVIEYGVNAAQAAAQPLRMQSKPCVIGDQRRLIGTEQSLAVLRLNGLTLELDHPNETRSELLTFASAGVDRALMRSSDPFIRELACLHGRFGQPRHVQILDTAFDRAEEIALDAIEQDHGSS